MSDVLRDDIPKRVTVAGLRGPLSIAGCMEDTSSGEQLPFIVKSKCMCPYSVTQVQDAVIKVGCDLFSSQILLYHNALAQQ